jgi:nitroreductase
MILDGAMQRALVAEASLAPSVHNVQPARWRFIEGGLLLFEDRTRRLPAADPSGRDTATSLGAAAEGMAIALSRHGLRLEDERESGFPDAAGDLSPVRRFILSENGRLDPLAGFVALRQSRRSSFLSPSPADREAARGLQADDAAVIAEGEAVAEIAALADKAGLGFFRDGPFRAELLSWMRLSPRHRRWSLDGLNADAMAMSRLDRIGAGLLLGRLFRLIDRLGLGGAVTTEAETVKSAAALIVFHRPAGEPHFEGGRAFYRLWLRVVEAGFQAAVMAALADDPAASEDLRRRLDLPDDRRIASVLRIGRAAPETAYPRARLPVEELLV